MKIHQLTFEKDNIMSKRLIAILLAVTVIIGCSKEPNNPEDDLTNSIRWVGDYEIKLRF